LSATEVCLPACLCPGGFPCEFFQAAPSCECGDDCEARKFFEQELEIMVNENDWIEGELSEDSDVQFEE